MSEDDRSVEFLKTVVEKVFRCLKRTEFFVYDRYEAIKQVTIITKEENANALAAAIKEEMNKTCTTMDSFGMISGRNKMLICYVNYFELPMIKELIGKSGGAFTTISTVDEIVK
jgi:uncharacterized membrane-anchored protein YitT (DUF2179 family)